MSKGAPDTLASLRVSAGGFPRPPLPFSWLWEGALTAHLPTWPEAHSHAVALKSTLLRTLEYFPWPDNSRYAGCVTFPQATPRCLARRQNADECRCDVLPLAWGVTTWRLSAPLPRTFLVCPRRTVLQATFRGPASA